MLLNFALILYIAAVWAFTFIFLKMEEADVPPITIMAGRAIIAFVCLLAVALITKKDLIGHFKYIGRFFVFAILGIVVLWLGLGFGQEYVSAGIGSVMVTTVPLLTFIILVFLLREEKFHITGLIGLLVGAVGIALVIGIQNILEGGATLKGVLLIGGGFVFFAINGVIVGKWAKGIDPVITSTYYLLLAGIILTVLAFIYESPTQVPWTVDNYLEELAIGVICTASGYFGYYYLIHKAGAFFSSLIFYFIPVFGMLAGFLLLNEKVTLPQVIGVAAIIVGVYLVNREKFKKG
ncbi:MAG: DMT family transporter [Nitrosomonadaceae bacterium]